MFSQERVWQGYHSENPTGIHAKTALEGTWEKETWRGENHCWEAGSEESEEA